MFSMSEGAARFLYACLLIGLGTLVIGAITVVAGAGYLLYRGICAVIGA